MGTPTKTEILALPPIARLGRYELLGRIAEGGMAEIFLARERAAHGATRLAALKRMRPDVAKDATVREMFEREGRLCMELRHPNICPIFEYGVEGGAPYLAMEWVHGVALSEIIARAGATGLPVEVVLKIVSDVASALHAAHTARSSDGTPLHIVHRDVTPENIMVAFDGTVRLVDFGIAKATIQRGKTEAGILKGKIGFMAPEQFAGGAVDGRADIFALGACLYEALSGTPLFERDSHAETMAAIVMGEAIPDLGMVCVDATPRLNAVFKKALARPVEERFRTADDFGRALEACSAELGRVVRATDLQAFLEKWFPGQRDAAPILDRRPLDRGEPTSDDLSLPSIEAELDEMSEQVAAHTRRKRWVVLGLGVMVVLLGGAAVLWQALHPGP